MERNYHGFPSQPFPEWKKTGVNRATVFYGFCSKHDGKLFRQADAISQNNLNSKALLSLAFRTFAMEMRKKDYYGDLTDRILKQGEGILDYLGADHLDGYNAGLKNCLRVTKPYYLSKFEAFFDMRNELPMAHRIFKFDRNLGISCSTFINPIPIFVQPLDKPQPMISFNILPRRGYTLVILLSLAEDSQKLDSFISENNRLEDLAFNYSEEVALSIPLYESFDKDLLQTIDKAQLPWTMWELQPIPDIFGASLDTDSLLAVL